jgi:hypothetical protein
MAFHLGSANDPHISCLISLKHKLKSQDKTDFSDYYGNICDLSQKSLQKTLFSKLPNCRKLLFIQQG